jgi:hypothetical protein
VWHGLGAQTRCDLFDAPLGLVSAVLAVIPMAWVICRIRKKNAVAKRLRPNCGCDPRASSTRCPERGTAMNRLAVQTELNRNRSPCLSCEFRSLPENLPI